MNATAKLSIIIPHYNSQNELKKLLNSIPIKYWIEVIVVDDRSEFDIFSLEKEFTHVKFYLSDKKIKGAGSARNLGLEKSTGDFLLFADADDFFLKDSFDIIEKNIALNQDVIYFNPTSKNLLTNQKGIRHSFYSGLINSFIADNNKDHLFKFDVPWSKLISKKIIKDNNIEFDEIIASNDINFSLKVVFYSSNILCVKDVVYCVTESANSLTNQHSEAILDSRFNAITRYNDFIKEKGLLHLQRAMIRPILHTYKYFGFYKTAYRYYYCKYKKYPIFNFKSYFKKVLRKLL